MNKKIKRITASIVGAAIITSILPFAVSADNEVFYSQDFGEIQNEAPDGWEKSGYIDFVYYNNSSEDAPLSVSGVALNAKAEGYGDRSAVIQLSDTITGMWENKNYVAFEFDIYMNGGVNTCNTFTLGYGQDDSFSDLSDTFFALANGDGVGARDTLRYYNYNSNEWISIPDVSNTWLDVRVCVDFSNNKMVFELKNNEDISIGTYGPFSFDSKFSDKAKFNKMVLSAFRTNGGEITLNTWIDNFTISDVSQQEKLLLGYNGNLPNGVIGQDFELMEVNNDIVLKALSLVPFDDVTNETVPVRVIDTEFMITELPKTGYLPIISFNNDSNGNVLINSKGALVSQINSTEYEILLGNYQKLRTNEWYKLKTYAFLTNDQDNAYYTFELTGDFGNGYETKDKILETRNSDKFRNLNLQIGSLENNSAILYKSFHLQAKTRPSLTLIYDENKGDIGIGDDNIQSEIKQEETVPKTIELHSKSGYDVVDIRSNNDDILSDLEMDFFNQGYRYTIPLKDKDITINVNFAEMEEPPISFTKENEPYPIDPKEPWDIRKYASEKRTYEVKNAKMAYRLYKPVNYNQEIGTKYPLVISLRAEGEGNTGFDNEPYTAGHIEDVLTSEKYAYDFPCFILSPQCYNENWTDNNWTNIAMVLSIIDIVTREFECIDTNRIYIGGLSGGANATWITTLIGNGEFAGAFILSGSALDIEFAQFYVDTPIWTFYAADDNAQRTPRTNRLMVDEVNKLGGNIIATEYPTGGHTVAWTKGLESPLFQWLFAQEKGKVVQDEELDRIIEDYNRSVQSSLDVSNNIVSPIDNSECQNQETVLGDMVTDAMRYYTAADAAVIRSDYLGEGISEGQVTEEDILNALPVKQSVSVVELTGIELKQLLTNSLTYYPEKDGRFLQVSGVEIIFVPTLRPSQRIKTIKINGNMLDENAKYKVAVTNNLISNKLNGTYDGELNIKQGYYQSIAQMFVNYINANEFDNIYPQMNRIILAQD